MYLYPRIDVVEQYYLYKDLINRYIVWFMKNRMI